MKVQRIAAVTVLAVLLAMRPTPAEAGFKSAMRKVGHVAKRTVIYVAAAIAVIEFCSHTECEF
jgi:hypothetical protein